MVLILLPSRVTAARQTTAIKASSKPYSARVAPSSLRVKNVLVPAISFFMRRVAPVQGFVGQTLKQRITSRKDSRQCTASRKRPALALPGTVARAVPFGASNIKNIVRRLDTKGAVHRNANPGQKLRLRSFIARS